MYNISNQGGFMFRFTKQTIKDFLKEWTLVIPYEIFIKLLLIGVITPLLSIGFRGVLRQYGATAVGNLDILKTLQSLPGALFLFAGVFILGYLVFLEVGGITIISASSITGEKMSIAQVFVGTHHYLRRMLSPSILLLIIYYFVFLPSMQLGMSTSLLQSITVPSFILNSVTSSALGSFLVAILSIVIFVLSLQWIFVIHYVIFADKPLKDAFKASRMLVMSNRWNFVKYFLGFTLIIGVLQVFIYFIILFIPMLMAAFMEEELAVFITTSMSALLSSLTLTVLTHLVQIPLFIYMLTRMFHLFDEHASLHVWKSKSRPIKTPFGRFFYRHRRGFIATSTILVILLGTLLSAVMFFVDEKMPITTITAHRGASAYAPENTMISIVKAVELGAEVAEIDIQELKDGTIVLFHDNNLKRTSRLSTKIYELTYDDLATIDVGEWFDPSFKGERIPTLEDVLAYSKGKIRLNIEIKKHGNEKALIENTIALIKKYDMMGETFITSLDYPTLEEVKAIDPSVKTGYVFFTNFGSIKDYNVDIYSIEAQYVSRALVDRIHELGREIHVWTVNDLDQANTFALMGVDSIITDQLVDVGRVVKYINQLDPSERFLESMFIPE